MNNNQKYICELPLVSIITPSFNHGKFIEKTILSVKKQSYRNIEHIIVDGGSNDNTINILKKYEKNYCMKWYSENDKGQADAIAKGFKLCAGEIVTWLNSDDIYLNRQTISHVVKLFDEYLNADVVTGGGIIIDENGKWLKHILVDKKRVCKKHLNYVDIILQPATFFRKKVLENIVLDISLHYAFDWDFFIKLIEMHNFLAVDEIWAGYRMWGGNKTASRSEKRSKELLEVTGRYLGKTSWQYIAIKIFCFLYKISDILPGIFQKKMKDLIRLFSRLLNILTFKRITIV